MVATIGRYADALYLTSDRKLFDPASKRYYDTLKELAIDSDEDLYEVGEIAKVAGGAFYIAPYGRRKYQWVFWNARFQVSLTHRGELPTVKIEPLAELLYEYDLRAVEHQAQEIVRYLTGNYSEQLVVSRFDLAVDFQIQGFELPSWKDVITRARKRRIDLDGDEANAITAGVKEQTFQVQVYNKTKDAFAKGASWFVQVWEASGAYEPSCDVWRAEIRMFREVLKSFEVTTVGDLLNALGDIIEYALVPTDEQGTWFRICDPESRASSAQDQHQRRGMAHWWAEVVSVMAEGLLTQGLKRKGDNVRMSWDRTINLAGGQIAKAAALLKMCGYLVPTSPRQIAQLVADEYCSQLGEMGWPDKVNEIMGRSRGEIWSPTIDHRVDHDPLWASRYCAA